MPVPTQAPKPKPVPKAAEAAIPEDVGLAPAQAKLPPQQLYGPPQELGVDTVVEAWQLYIGAR